MDEKQKQNAIILWIRSCATSLLIFLAVIIGSCSILLVVVFAEDILGLGSSAKVAYTGSLAREYEDHRPLVNCLDIAGISRPKIQITEHFGGFKNSKGYIFIVFPVNPSTGTFSFFTTDQFVGPWNFSAIPEHEFAIGGWLFGDEASLQIDGNLKEGTITIESVRGGWQKRVKGSFEATLYGNLYGKSDNNPVHLNGNFSIVTAGHEDVGCLR